MATVDAFLGTIEEYSKSDIVVLPVPYDKTSTWQKGADKGPKAIMDASLNLEVYDIVTDSEVYKKGIFTADKIDFDGSSEELADITHKKVSDYLKDNKFVVTLGGDHAVSIGVIKAHFDFFKDISVLHLDAHADFRDNFHGDKYNHACVMRRVSEYTKPVFVEIRSLAKEEKDALEGHDVFYGHEIAKDSGWIDRVISLLKNKKVYITLDLDVLDPSIMPSTGTPEPGGLSWYQLMDLFEKLSKEKKIVGFDVVELCPNEQNKAPDFLAAKLIYKLLSWIKA